MSRKTEIQVSLVPSWAELAERHQSTVRHHQREAQRLGDIPSGRDHVAKAQASARLANQARIESVCVLLLRDGFPEAAAALRSGAVSLDDVRKFRIAAEEAARRV